MLCLVCNKSHRTQDKATIVKFSAYVSMIGTTCDGSMVFSLKWDYLKFKSVWWLFQGIFRWLLPSDSMLVSIRLSYVEFSADRQDKSLCQQFIDSTMLNLCNHFGFRDGAEY